jgi:hypothetical protein
MIEYLALLAVSLEVMVAERGCQEIMCLQLQVVS